MKTKIPLLTLLGLSLTATAQTNQTPPATVGGFAGQVITWGTSFDTNSTTFLHPGQFWTAVSSGDALNNELGVSYKLLGGLAPEAIVRNGGVQGVLDSFQGGVGYSVRHWDFELRPYADAGYKFPDAEKKVFGEFGLRVSKAISTYGYVLVGYGVQTCHKGQQVFEAGAGFAF